MLDPQQLNRYVYVRNNPLKYLDPDGRDLKLAPGLKQADVDRIFKRLVNTYRKQSGRDAIERLEQSKTPITVGTGKLPSKVDLLNQVVTEKYQILGLPPKEEKKKKEKD